MKTDLELQLALAKMLPEKIHVVDVAGNAPLFYLLQLDKIINKRLDEFHWLHVCWLIEQDIATRQKIAFEKYQRALENTVYGTNNQLGWITRDLILASWQQRANALIAVKGEK